MRPVGEPRFFKTKKPIAGPHTKFWRGGWAIFIYSTTEICYN